MSSDSRSASRPLPARPSLEHLRNEAKQRHKLIKHTDPSARLADAQRLVAREYGFASWRQLKASVDKAPAPHDSPLDRFAGFYLFDPIHLANAAVAVTQAGGRLSIQTTGGPKLELTEQDSGVFSLPGLTTTYRFEAGPDGRVSGLEITSERGTTRLTPVDAHAARAAEAAFHVLLAEQAQDRTEVAVAGADLERLVGFYSTPVGPPIEVSRVDGRMYARVAGQPASEFHPESETKLFSRRVHAQLSFELTDGEATTMVLHQNGHARRVPRVSEAEARRIGAPVEHKAEAEARPRTAIKVPAAVLQIYAGQYDLVAGKRMTVTAEGDRLFVQMSGQERYEVFAETEQTFFWTITAAQITFIVQADGRVTRAVLHQAGRDIPLGRREVETAGTDVS